MSRRREMVAMEHLPYDSRVEYLESHGAEYIDTGLALGKGDVISAVVFQNSTSGNYAFYGASNGGTIYTGEVALFYYYDTKIDFCYATSATKSSFTGLINIWLGEDMNISQKSNQVTINGTTYIGSSFEDFEGSVPMLLFACNRNGATYKSKCRIKSFSIGSRIDLVPVRVGSVGYMYDRITRKLFGNAGTGAFTVGPDVSAANWGGYKLKCARRSYRRSSRPSARFCALPRWEVAA